SSRSYPAKDRKLSLAKISGWLTSFASVNTIAMRVVSAATTNGPSSFRKLSTSDSAAFCSLDLFPSLGMSDILSAQAGAELWLIAIHEQRWRCCDVDRAGIRL